MARCWKRKREWEREVIQLRACFLPSSTCISRSTLARLSRVTSDVSDARYSRARSLQKCRNHVTRYCERHNSAYTRSQRGEIIRPRDDSKLRRRIHLINMRRTEWRRGRQARIGKWILMSVYLAHLIHVDPRKRVCYERNEIDNVFRIEYNCIELTWSYLNCHKIVSNNLLNWCWSISLCNATELSSDII